MQYDEEQRNKELVEMWQLKKKEKKWIVNR